MNKYTSEVIKTSDGSFPEFKGERFYMVPFFKKEGLPMESKHWQPTVDQMLQGVDTDQEIYIMIDQSFVKAGTSHRRPGLHIDGYWVASESGHSGYGAKKAGKHGGHCPMKMAGKHSSHGGSKKAINCWDTATFEESEVIILASNVSAARAFTGSYQGVINSMGNCAHLSTEGLKEVMLEANKTYIGNVNFLHESLPVSEDCFRTVVRLNVPGFSL